MGHKVGELAAATGLTVRTLHYFEEIGLLVASERSDSGHRLYNAADVERLYRISVLRRLGFPLGEIGRALDDPHWSLQSALRSHLDELEQRFEATTRLRNRLLRLQASDIAREGTLDQELIEALEEMTMLETTVQKRITYLVYTDLDATCEYLERVFGLGPSELHRDGGGNVVHAELQAGDGAIWLHRESQAGLASPRTLGAATAGVAVMVDDVDAHHRHAVAEGAVIEYGPTDQPYGYREYSARDNEGGLWSFMRPLKP